MFHDYIQIYFSTIILSIFIFIFVNANPVLSKKSIHRFSLASIAVILLVIAECTELWCASLSHPVTLRVVVSIIGYFLRPGIIYLILTIVCQNHLSKKNNILLALPAILNGLIMSTALFSPVTFSYGPDNHFIRGPLGLTPFVTSAFYLVMLVIMTEKLYKSRQHKELLITVTIVIINILATGLSVLYQFKGFITITGISSIVFYYMYLTTQQFKRDPLTGALTRRYFYIDAAKKQNQITAVVSIDLNNLKQNNDLYGHAEGDKALCTVASCMQISLERNCYLYRTGGDEFMILCFRQDRINIQKMILKITAQLQKTPYTCAIGTAFLNKETDFEKACSIADAKMYENKRFLKKGQEIR